jgi:hypothetical protein
VCALPRQVSIAMPVPRPGPGPGTARPRPKGPARGTRSVAGRPRRPPSAGQKSRVRRVPAMAHAEDVRCQGVDPARGQPPVPALAAGPSGEPSRPAPSRRRRSGRRSCTAPHRRGGTCSDARVPLVPWRRPSSPPRWRTSTEAGGNPALIRAVDEGVDQLIRQTGDHQPRRHCCAGCRAVRSVPPWPRPSLGRPPAPTTNRPCQLACGGSVPGAGTHARTGCGRSAEDGPRCGRPGQSLKRA